jgi:hypothetical protein
MTYLTCGDGLREFPAISTPIKLTPQGAAEDSTPAQARPVLLVLDETSPLTERAANVKTQYSERRREPADDEKQAV